MIPRGILKRLSQSVHRQIFFSINLKKRKKHTFNDPKQTHWVRYREIREGYAHDILLRCTNIHDSRKIVRHFFQNKRLTNRWDNYHRSLTSYNKAVRRAKGLSFGGFFQRSTSQH